MSETNNNKKNYFRELLISKFNLRTFFIIIALILFESVIDFLNVFIFFNSYFAKLTLFSLASAASTESEDTGNINFNKLSMIYYYDILNNITNYTISLAAASAQNATDNHVKIPVVGTLILLAVTARWVLILLGKMFYARDERMRNFIKMSFKRKSSPSCVPMVSWHL